MWNRAVMEGYSPGGRESLSGNLGPMESFEEKFGACT